MVSALVDNLHHAGKSWYAAPVGFATRMSHKTSAVAGNGGSIMSFDALTISGVVAALVSAALILGVAGNNERLRSRDKQDPSTD